jgi:hypothetical protein
MDEETLRKIEAQSSATLFIAESAFVLALKLHTPIERAEILSMFLEVSTKIDHLHAENESDAERIADVFVQTQQMIKASLVKVAELVGVTLESPSSDES